MTYISTHNDVLAARREPMGMQAGQGRKDAEEEKN